MVIPYLIIFWITDNNFDGKLYLFISICLKCKVIFIENISCLTKVNIFYRYNTILYLVWIYQHSFCVVALGEALHKNKYYRFISFIPSLKGLIL